MRVLRIAAAIGFIVLPVLASASPAHATLSGPCTATGTLNGKTYDSKTITKVVIPRKGDVHWAGSVTTSNGKRPISGYVRLKLPWPIPAQDLGSWGKSSDSKSNSNVYHYDLPSELAGIDMPLSGQHKEPGVVCTGVVVVRIKGGGISNPAVIGAFVVLVLSGIGLWVALKPKGV